MKAWNAPHLRNQLHRSSNAPSLLQIWRTIYSIKVKIVTRAKGHGGTPHPIELTRPGWLAFQLPSTQTGVSNRWAKCKLISAQHTIRGRAGVTTVHHFRHGKRKSEAFWSLCKHKITVGALLLLAERFRPDLYTLVGVCPTVLLADRSAQVIQTGRILGCSRRKPQCQRWSSRTQFYSGEWSWQGFLDQSSWPLHTGRHTQGYRYTEMETKHVLFGKHQGGSLLSPFLHFWSVSASKTNANWWMHLGPVQRVGNIDWSTSNNIKFKVIWTKLSGLPDLKIKEDGKKLSFFGSAVVKVGHK